MHGGGAVVEWLVPALTSLLQLAFLGLIVWLIVQAVGRRRGEAEAADQATSVRRLFEYGLMFTTLVLTAVGAVMILQELAGSAGDDPDDNRTALAFGLALVIVAGPAYGLLLRHGCRRLRDDAAERCSFSWGAYLNLSLLVSLIVTTAAAQQILEGVTGVDDFEVASVVPVVVWGAAWLMHWFWLRAAFDVPGDWHLATGSLTGLVTLVLGLGGLVFVAGDAVYRSVVERVPAGHEEPELRTWAIAATIGALIWSWHWLARYLGAERTSLWHVYVVMIGALGGLVAAVASAAALGYWTLVWFVGDPSDTLGSQHFEYVPSVPAATFVVGAVAWQYHRYVLQRGHDIERTEPLRAYDYLMAAAGLVSTVVGVTVALVALLEAITPEPVGTETQAANRLILAATLTVIGGSLWTVFWSRIRRHVSTGPEAELRSMVRRIYLVVLFGVGGIVVLISLINVLFIGFQDLLDGTFGGQTARSFRVGLSLMTTVTGVAWYHLGVFRSDRSALIRMEPLPLPPPPAPSARHVVLVAPRGSALADELAATTGADVETWYRTDETAMPSIDIHELAGRIENAEPGDVFVIVGVEGPILIPVEP
ncbi:MAG: DUF5671 domain-containing protein [Acidimicrobiia bacterium]|nr:DUF5671 domain-containing protein [Acidimicrobiia bacterium]